jgi:hypothetical protein
VSSLARNRTLNTCTHSLTFFTRIPLLHCYKTTHTHTWMLYLQHEHESIDERFRDCRYYTAFAYLVTVLLCFAYRRNCFQLLASKLHLRRRRRHDYCDIPDHADSRNMHHHHHDAGLPLFQSSSSSGGAGGGGMMKSGRRRRHYCTSALWNRCSIVMRNLWQRWCCGLRFSVLLGRHDTKRRSE